jgi:regulator of protease activity HflC (stomatin/prohibitin superfamily)
MKASSTFKIGAAIALLIVVFSMGGSFIKLNVQGHSQVLQAIDGTMSARMTPGWYPIFFHKVNDYKQYVTVGFGKVEGEGTANIDAIDVIFSDGSKADISGIIRVEVPGTANQIIELQRRFSGGYNHFITNGVVPVVENAVRLAANLRTAQEGYTTLAAFQSDIEDQLKNGIFMTKVATEITTNDAGETEKIRKTERQLDSLGNPIRSKHALQELGCRVVQCQIKVPAFDKNVEQAIMEQKQASLRTQIAKQEALKAEQEAKTIAAKGQAEATAAKWEQEKIKATKVTEAQQQKEVASLQKDAAEFEKQKQILLGQGEAERKRLILAADGALDKKLEAYKEVQGLWAKAFAEGYKVPGVMMGGNGSAGTTGAWEAAANTITLKNMKELGLDMTIPSGAKR